MAFRRGPRNTKKKEHFARKLGRAVNSGGIIKTLKVSICLISLSIIIFGAWHLYNELLMSPYLSIKEVRISGNMRVSKSEILKLAGSGIGDNLLAINMVDMRNAIKANSWVADVSISRDFPDGLDIEIRERSPIAVVNLDGLYFVDEAGVIFKKMALSDEIDLPVITGLIREDIEEHASTSELAIKAVSLIHLLVKRKIIEPEELSEINIDKTYGLTLYTMRDGVKIELGSDDFEGKVERLEKIIMSRNGLAGVELVSLNSDGAVLKLIPEEAPFTNKVGKRAKGKRSSTPTSI